MIHMSVYELKGNHIKNTLSLPSHYHIKPLYIRDLTNIYLRTFNNNKQQNREKTMNNLPKLVMALFALSSVVDIAEKIHNWGRDKKNEKEEEKKEEEPSRV